VNNKTAYYHKASSSSSSSSFQGYVELSGLKYFAIN
jgi:hypothetical protein